MLDKKRKNIAAYLFSKKNGEFSLHSVSEKPESVENQCETKNNEKTKERTLKEESINIFFLIGLYLLQGIPLGLSGSSIPFLLQERHSNYNEQSIFSVSTWTFSLKILWAPLVDSVYWKRMGRRKFWLITVQYIIGLTMVILSVTVSSLMGDKDGVPKVVVLTCAFFFLNFLVATQDISVDGWALSMLSRKYVGYAATCNNVGQIMGIFIGTTIFLALESADFSNKYLRAVPNPKEGIITLSSFLMFWGGLFLVTTTFVLIFKKEIESDADKPLKFQETYKALFHILRLKSIWLIIAILFTRAIGFAAMDSATDLKLVEAGVAKETLAMLSAPIFPLKIIIPFLICRWTSGPSPLNVFLKVYPCRVLLGIAFTVLFWWTPISKRETGEFPFYYYVIILILYALKEVSNICIIIACVAFFAKVSNPVIGGTYMTLLNTVYNLGYEWPKTIALSVLDPLTFTVCTTNSSYITCNVNATLTECGDDPSACLFKVDGYYSLTGISIILGLIWLLCTRKIISRLQKLPASDWL